MAIFKRELLQLVLTGKKTQSRRTHLHRWKVGRTYAVRDQWFTKPKGHILVTRAFRQRLGQISPQDVQKEGFSSLEEFQQAWARIHGAWDPEQLITVYEFRLQPPTRRLSTTVPTSK